MTAEQVAAPAPLDGQAMLVRAIAGMGRDRDARWAPVAGWLSKALAVLKRNPRVVDGGVLPGGEFDHAFLVARTYLRMNANGSLIAADPAAAPPPVPTRSGRPDRSGGTIPLRIVR